MNEKKGTKLEVTAGSELSARLGGMWDGLYEPDYERWDTENRKAERTKEEVKRVCEKCLKNGDPFAREVARTVERQGFVWTRRQESIVCAGASFKGVSPMAHYQSGDNPTEDDFFNG